MRPSNFGLLHGFTHCGSARGPQHDDFIAFQAIIYRGRVKDVKWSGTGCGLVMAAASIISDSLVGKYWFSVGLTASEKLATLRKFDKVCLQVVQDAVDACFCSGSSTYGC
jgi:NifU-like protein involved in Fe-S cluster formation